MIKAFNLIQANQNFSNLLKKKGLKFDFKTHYFVALLILFVIIGDIKIFHEKLKKNLENSWKFWRPLLPF